MTIYADEIASAGADIAAAGAPITFTRTVLGAYNPATGATTPTTSTATSAAIGVKPFRTDYMRLEAGGLVLKAPVTLLVAAHGLAFSPQPGDTFAWGGFGYTVRSVDPTAIDGTAILYRIVGSR